ncbi:MAG TPA: hypothetical protein VL172_15140 [Kofleriaceae bacterium]|nr:hypothetical protein [Kofleriaceae bacterium]
MGRTTRGLLAALLLAACGAPHGDGRTDGGTGGDDAAPTDDASPHPDALPGDSDGDGLRDDTEGRFDAGGPRDTDGDGTPDYQDTDSDDDSIPDADEGAADWDADGEPNYTDPVNDGAPPEVLLTALTTPFNSPIGIDYHEPTDSVMISVNYPTGSPLNFERVEANGDHQSYSTFSGLTDEVKIGTVRSGNVGGFVTGDLFVGNGVDGQIARITDGGNTIINPWVDLTGDNNGLMRGGLHVDRTGLFGGDLLVSTAAGEVWRINSAGVAAPRLAAVGTHLEGAQIVPYAPARYGPLAGMFISGAEETGGLIYAVSPGGNVVSYNVGVNIEDIDIINPKENFFGVNFGTSTLLGADHEQVLPMVGDILLTQESPTGTGTGLFVLRWDGIQLYAQQIPLAAGSATVGQWEHTTFAPAGIAEIPPVE